MHGLRGYRRILLLLVVVVCLFMLFYYQIDFENHSETSTSNTESSKFGALLIFDNDNQSSEQSGNMDIFLICNVPQAEYQIYLLFYSDDPYFSKAENRKTVEKDMKESVQRCVDHGTKTNIATVIIPNRAEDGRFINNVLQDAYILHDLDYFYLAFKSLPIGNSKLMNWKQLVQTLHGVHPSGIGIVPTFVGSQVQSLFASKTHFEIFGDFFQWSIPDLKSAVEFTLAVYPQHLTTAVKKSEFVNVKWRGQFNEASKTLTRYLSAVQSAPTCLRCRHQTSRRVIAMSLYGDNKRYTIGAIRNAQLFPVTFPGWRLWFYCERPELETGETTYGQVPSTILDRLTGLGAEIRYVNPIILQGGPRLWRFTVVDDLDVEAFVIRDCDSRLTVRDAAVVSYWLNTNTIFHCIRDHPSHSNYIINAGMWGGIRRPLSKLFDDYFTNLMRPYNKGDYLDDTNFLNNVVWPKVKAHTYCHDSFSCTSLPASHPFPVKREGYEHLGQVYDEHSVGRQGDIDIIAVAILKNPNNTCVPVIDPK